MKRWTLQDVARHWDHSPDYDAQNAKIDSYLRRFFDSAPLFTISAHAKVLDVDCRTGNGTVFFSQKYPTAKFSCIAMAESFKTRAEKNLSAHGVDATVEVMSELTLPFEDETFDVVLSYETLEHVPWQHDFVVELSRVLKPGGTLVLTTPNVLWEPVHWLSATLHLDHGEGPHRMVPRCEILNALEDGGFLIEEERTFVLIPAGPKWLLNFGKSVEKVLPQWLLRMIALRRTFICTKTKDYWWHRLQKDILEPRLETQCGTSVGVSNGTLAYEEIDGELVLTRTDNDQPVPRAAYDANPSRFCDYPDLNRFTFKKEPDNWLSGVVEKAYVGHMSDEAIRRNGASGGVITGTLIHLLQMGKIKGAVCLQMGNTVPWKAEPVVARTKEEILACAQSVYSQTPVNTILAELDKMEGPLAYVGLPDQVAAIRKLQQMDHLSVRNIAYVFGPYMGTQMSFEAIRSFLRSHGVQSEEEITDLKYRAGEWPGYLQITLKSGRVLKAEKFYYNYLIPFFITRGSLQLVDFTNELTDFSVGDAWSPKYEEMKGGHSVILARTEQAISLLQEMRDQELIELEEITLDEALDMHGHMLDFKKRGSFIRNTRKCVTPDYGYKAVKILMSRRAVESCLGFFFWVGSLQISRWTVEHLPLSVVGPFFNTLRKTWKNASKPTKRKGLRDTRFAPTK